MGLNLRHIILSYILVSGLSAKAQDVELPVDLRQHNLTEYNSSLFSPVFSLDRNQPQSLAFWSRWQWQIVDEDPTTFFLNYSRRINRSMAGGIAAFQQNTGGLLNTGAVLNYAFTAEIAPGLDIAAGLNLFGYQRELADESFLGTPGLIPDPEDIDAFILQVAPAVQLSYGQLSLGVVAENLLQYNFSSSRNEEGDTGNILIGYLGSQIPLDLFSGGGTTYLQPTVYFKRIPGFDNQVGISALFSTSRFWVQGGYNSFYGVSGGIGGRFFRNFSIGALVEYGTQADLQDRDPSFELVTAFNFGRRWKPEEDEITSQEEDEPILEINTDLPAEEQKDVAAALEDQSRKADSLSRLERERRLIWERDSIAAVQKLQEDKLAEQVKQRRQDSIVAVQKAEQQRAIAQRKQDSINKQKAAQQQSPQTPRKGEKYEEVVNEEGIAPGYYLIANVFGTKRYFDAFMKSLRERGLDPKSFYRESRKYNYVYLGKYSSMEAARQARDSQLNGRYKDDLWILRMVGDN